MASSQLGGFVICVIHAPPLFMPPRAVGGAYVTEAEARRHYWRATPEPLTL
jgi:hypothetical protein